MPRLAQQGHCLQPAEDLFDAFAPVLTNGVPWVGGRAPINGTGPTTGMLRHMGRRSQLLKRSDEGTGVIVLVGAQPHAMLTGNGLYHSERRFALGGLRRLGHTRIHHQVMAILYEGVPQVAEFVLLPLPLLVQTDLGIGGRGMRGVRPPLLWKSTLGLPGSSGISENVSAAFA
jgi:hypothetical protein